jgi:hypothetical protein
MADGRTVSEAQGVGSGDAVVMRTLLYGVRARGAGPLVVVPDVGFGDTEKLDFTLLLETLQPEPASY